MATGSGKTYTAISAIYRLLKFADAKHILFLVDTRNLGGQDQQEFMGYTPTRQTRPCKSYTTNWISSGPFRPICGPFQEKVK